MPTFVTRRTALGVVAAAALASLTACASDIRPLQDPSVVDPMRPYK
ncbi:MAG: 3-isopropylmalate dehydrogenase, partial [Rothia mucilaginosa]|nr:3-isopropylmalate dehydrogenase [Rothia mucilaginosa]